MTQRRNQTTIEGLISESLRARLLETHTMLPGVIESFDAETVRADVRIALKRESEDLDGVRTTLDWPKLADVPVCFPHFGGFSFTLPVAVGDEVLIQFAQRDMSKWLENGVEQAPVSLRAHDLSDAVVLVGMNSKPSQITTYSATDLVIQSPVEANAIRMTPDGDIAVTGRDITATASGGVTITGGGDVKMEGAAIELGVSGGDDVLSLLEDLIDQIKAILIVDPVSGNLSVLAASQTALDVVKAKIAAMKI